MSRFAVVEAPSHLGLRAAGVEKLPCALLGAGLAVRLRAHVAARLPAPRFRPQVDPETRILNPLGLRDFAYALADAVEPLVRRHEFPIVLGGDCSILLGIALALRRIGRYGLMFLDGHADFYQPEVEPSGEAASMELALVTGRGPEVVVNLESRGPLVRDEDTVVYAYRDADIAAAEGSQPLPSTLFAMDLATTRKLGSKHAACQAIRHLTPASGPTGFWIHLDVDVLDDEIMPAVDYRIPGGLSWSELVTVLHTAMASGRAVGLNVTIYNPRLDPDGRYARALVNALVTALAG